MRFLKKIILNILILNTPSCLLRAKILRMFGANIGEKCMVESIILLNYNGDNLKNLILGNSVYIGAGTIIDIKEQIHVKDSTKIAAGCNFSTHVDSGNENYISSLYPRREAGITIGSNCWVGLSVTVLCGVTIGNEVVVGACSLVNKDIDNAKIIYGIPAKEIRSIRRQQ